MTNPEKESNIREQIQEIEARIPTLPKDIVELNCCEEKVREVQSCIKLLFDLAIDDNKSIYLKGEIKGCRAVMAANKGDKTDFPYAVYVEEIAYYSFTEGGYGKNNEKTGHFTSLSIVESIFAARTMVDILKQNGKV